MSTHSRPSQADAAHPQVSRFSFTIKKLLLGAVLMGIGVVSILATNSLVSHQRLAANQQLLTQLSLPLAEAGSQFQVALSALLADQQRLAQAPTLAKLNGLGTDVSSAARFTAARQPLQAMAAHHPKLAQILPDLDRAYQQLLAKHQAFYQALQLRLQGQTNGLDALADELATAVTALNQQLQRLHGLALALSNQAIEEAQTIRAQTETINWSVALVAALLMAGAGALIAKRVIAPIKRAVTFVEVLACGDFTTDIDWPHQDELGVLIAHLRQMAASLNGLLAQAQRSGVQITSSATELAATAKHQERVMDEQLQATQKVSKAVNTISRVTEELAGTMRQVAATSQETAGFASHGQADLARMQHAMQQMEAASTSISGKLETINEKANNITHVVITIARVADQTNLLSLNAAIEAEKAGEYGRGFTVVAREIRRLADQTAVATLDIEGMVKGMQGAVASGVQEMGKFIIEVRRSAEDVEKISVQLARIIEQVQLLSPNFEQVHLAAAAQSHHAHKIDQTMQAFSEEMRQITQSLSESFLAIEQLNEAARGLQEEMTRFKVFETGSAQV